MDITKDVVSGFRDVLIPYTLIKQDNQTKKLAIIFPGAGYTVQGPLLHYSTGICLKKGYDVLEITYQYTEKIYDSFSVEELNDAIKNDVRAVINRVLDKYSSYEDFILVGKSLGTIAMKSELTRTIFSDAKAIWLTPLLQRDDVFETMMNSHHKGLCFIGGNDPCYIKERFEQISLSEHIDATFISGLDHSLEYIDQPIKSIDVLKRVMTEIEKFV